MLLLLALPVLVAVAALHRYLQVYAPSNQLVRRARIGPASWRTVAALFAVSAVLLVAMHVVAEAVAAGAPSWLNLVVLVLAWDAIKLCTLGVLTTARASLVVSKRVASGVARSRTPTSTFG